MRSGYITAVGSLLQSLLRVEALAKRSFGVVVRYIQPFSCLKMAVRVSGIVADQKQVLRLLHQLCLTQQAIWQMSVGLRGI
jgi:hypothetical protein